MSFLSDTLGNINSEGFWEGNDSLNQWVGSLISTKEIIKISQVLNNKNHKEKLYSLEHLCKEYPNQPILMLNLASLYISLLNFTDCHNMLNKVLNVCLLHNIVDDKLLKWRETILKECIENAIHSEKEYNEESGSKIYSYYIKSFSKVFYSDSLLKSAKYIASMWNNKDYIEKNRDIYSRLVVININEVDNVFYITNETIKNIINSDSNINTLIDTKNYSLIKDQDEIIKIINSTSKALKECELLCNSPLRSSTIIEIHRNLIYNLRFTKHSFDTGLTFYTVVEIDRWRESNMFIRTDDDKYMYFCSVSKIQSSIDDIIDEYNKLEFSHDNINPLKVYAIAAWLYTSILGISPFSTGNSRLARLIASIPLLRANLPPIIINNSFRSRYDNIIEKIRGSKDLTPLIEIFVESTRLTMAILSK
ncbi:hypothetical protein HDU92_008474 [Lobulomyces angularis]|nr:hypothetical protein HDU92_008474 [Lobulomyces angularis]